MWMSERDILFPTFYRWVPTYEILTPQGSRSVPRCHDLLELTVKATNLERPVWPLIPDIGTRRPSSILSTTGWEADPVLFPVDFRTREVFRLAEKADCSAEITQLFVRWFVQCLDKFHTCKFAVVCWTRAFGYPARRAKRRALGYTDRWNTKVHAPAIMSRGKLDVVSLHSSEVVVVKVLGVRNPRSLAYAIRLALVPCTRGV
jgi:hypothetical protein